MGKYWCCTFSILIVLVAYTRALNCDTRNHVYSDPEWKLKQRLMCNYDKTLRSSAPNVTRLTVVMTPNHVQYDSTIQMLKINAYLGLLWKDNRLTWQESEFMGVQKFPYVSTEFWLPDFAVFHTLSRKGPSGCMRTTCIVQSDGAIHCSFQCIYSALCEGDFKNWPFDKQNCSLFLGSRSLQPHELDFAAFKILLSQKSYSVSWDIKSTVVERQIKQVEGFNHSVLNFKFMIARRRSFHVSVIIVPLLAMIALNLLSLYLEALSIERFCMVFVNLMAHLIYIQQISWFIPRNGALCPSIILLFRDSLLITVFCFIETILFRYLCKHNKKCPVWMDYFSLKLGLTLNKAAHRHEFQLFEEEILNYKSIETRDQRWNLFAQTIDRILMAVVGFIYVVLVALLFMPLL